VSFLLTRKVGRASFVRAFIFFIEAPMSTDDRDLSQTNEPTEAEASLPIKDIGRAEVNAPEAEQVKGGAFEIKDWSFGVENPTTIGRA
jgi:hypothetical protein